MCVCVCVCNRQEEKNKFRTDWAWEHEMRISLCMHKVSGAVQRNFLFISAFGSIMWFSIFRESPRKFLLRKSLNNKPAGHREYKSNNFKISQTNWEKIILLKHLFAESREQDLIILRSCYYFTNLAWQGLPCIRNREPHILENNRGLSRYNFPYLQWNTELVGLEVPCQLTLHSTQATFSFFVPCEEFLFLHPLPWPPKNKIKLKKPASSGSRRKSYLKKISLGNNVFICFHRRKKNETEKV